MFALLFSYFIKKVNRVAIDGLNFAVGGLHCLKNLKKNRSVRQRRKSRSLSCKTLFILRNATGNYRKI